jgi:urease accessory protein
MRIVVVARTLEPALVIRISEALDPDERVRHAALLGHAFGNQHVPVDVDGAELRVPLTTSEAVARFTVEALGLDGLTVSVEDVALARRSPLHATGHGHAPDV